ncbi:MAG: hypothetical protein RL260_3140 [Pseudomonadota bacterium]
MKSGGAKAYMADPRNWVDGMNQEKYLSSKETQDTAFATVNNKVYQQLAKVDPSTGKGLVDQSTPPERVAALLKAAHVGGMRGARAVASGATGAKDHNGTSPQKYAADIAQDAGGYRAAVEAAKLGRTGTVTPAQGRPDVAATDPAPATQTAKQSTPPAAAAAAAAAPVPAPATGVAPAGMAAVPATAAPTWLVATPVPASAAVVTAAMPSPDRATAPTSIPRPVASAQPEPSAVENAPARRMDSGGGRDRVASAVTPAPQNVSDRHIANVITGGIGAN